MSRTVDIQGLSRCFGGQAVLDAIDLDIAPGEFVSLLGRSGSGKSTLLRIMAGLDQAPARRLVLPKRRSVVFQEPRLLPWKSVLDNIILGLKDKDRVTRACHVLEEVGLGHRTGAWPLTLSGGEAQRAALARALVREPELLLLDEPFASLDALTRLKMHALVVDLWRKHAPSILLVTHDVWEAVTLANRVLVLDQGRIVRQLVVDLPYPRHRLDARTTQIETELLADLGIETFHSPHKTDTTETEPS